jgi:signal transduction histidine kinase
MGAHGLQSMQHRLQPFGGHLNVEQNEPSGTRVRVRVTLEAVTVAPPAPSLDAA